MSEPIKVWRFWDAPEELRNLSANGGDEDWIAVVPPHMRDADIGWLESQRFDSGQHPQIIQREDGSVVWIGSHA